MMLRHLLFIGLSYLACISDLVLRDDTSIGAVPIEWLVLTIVGAMVWFDSATAVLYAAGIGLLSDCLSTGSLGVGMLTAILTVYLILKCQRNGRLETVSAIVGAAAILTWCIGWSSAIAELRVLEPVDWGRHAIVTAGSAIYTSLIVLICCVFRRRRAAAHD